MLFLLPPIKSTSLEETQMKVWLSGPGRRLTSCRLRMEAGSGGRATGSGRKWLCACWNLWCVQMGGICICWWTRVCLMAASTARCSQHHRNHPNDASCNNGAAWRMAGSCKMEEKTKMGEMLFGHFIRYTLWSSGRTILGPKCHIWVWKCPKS